MRRAMKKGSWVKVMAPLELHNDNASMAEKLGASEAFMKTKTPQIGDEGEVLGIEDGFVLVKFEEFESLVDVSSLEMTAKKEEVKIIVIYPNKAIEEFANQDQVTERMKEMFAKQHLKMGDQVQVYDVSGYRKVKVLLEVSFT